MRGTAMALVDLRWQRTFRLSEERPFIGREQMEEFQAAVAAWAVASGPSGRSRFFSISPRSGQLAGAAAGGGGLIWPKNPVFQSFSVISGLWHLRWRAAWILTILTFQGGAIRAIRNFWRWAGCRKADL